MPFVSLVSVGQSLKAPPAHGGGAQAGPDPAGVNTSPWTTGSHRGTACCEAHLEPVSFSDLGLKSWHLLLSESSPGPSPFPCKLSKLFQALWCLFERSAQWCQGTWASTGPGETRILAARASALEAWASWHQRTKLLLDGTWPLNIAVTTCMTIPFLRDGSDLGHIWSVFFAPSPDSLWSSLLGGFIEPENKEGVHALSTVAMATSYP